MRSLGDACLFRVSFRSINIRRLRNKVVTFRSTIINYFTRVPRFTRFRLCYHKHTMFEESFLIDALTVSKYKGINRIPLVSVCLCVCVCVCVVFFWYTYIFIFLMIIDMLRGPLFFLSFHLFFFRTFSIFLFACLFVIYYLLQRKPGTSRAHLFLPPFYSFIITSIMSHASLLFR